MTKPNRGPYKRKPLRSVCAECGGTNLGSTYSDVKGRRYPKPYCKDCRYRKAIDKTYGLSLADYDQMLADQGGGCAACGSSKPGSKRTARFAVDHNHLTGANRGLLCYACNFALGLCKDDVCRLQALIAYLHAHA